MKLNYRIEAMVLALGFMVLSCGKTISPKLGTESSLNPSVPGKSVHLNFFKPYLGKYDVVGGTFCPLTPIDTSWSGSSELTVSVLGDKLKLEAQNPKDFYFKTEIDLSKVIEWKQPYPKDILGIKINSGDLQYPDLYAFTFENNVLVGVSFYNYGGLMWDNCRLAKK